MEPPLTTADLEPLGQRARPGRWPGRGARPPPRPRSRRGRRSARALGTARDALVSEGLEVAVVSGGSTPSWAHLDTGVVNEARPGRHVFGDAQQWELGHAWHPSRSR